ncbi:helix-turn-helix transcriptional regulator [Halodurantibacterium flavum]|uniref:Helix-turn-helix transcriptional regulator n=1 Tax=Halodurantibacterium flavum TaxID=1382802 RepID=A0ABW4S3U7_9RHOB
MAVFQSPQLYLSVEQVAERLCVSKDSIWRWVREQNFPKPVKLSGRTTRWRLADILDWEGSLQTNFCFSMLLETSPAVFMASVPCPGNVIASSRQIHAGSAQ